MNKKNKILSLLLVALVTIYIWENYLENKNSKSILKSQVLNVDPDNITKIIVKSKNKIDTMSKKNMDWLLLKNGINISAKTSDINKIIDQLSNIKIDRLISNSNKNWEKYELTDSLNTLVEIFEINNISTKIYFGKTDFEKLNNSQNYNPMSQNQLPRSYIRINEDSRIYQISSYLGLMFSMGLNSFRQNELTNMDSIVRIEINQNNSVSKSYTYEDSLWVSSDNKVLDSLKFETYLKYISKLSLEDFYDDSNLSPEYSSKLIIVNQLREEVSLYAYQDTISSDYVLTSSANLNNYFRLKDSEEYSKIFFQNRD